MTTKERIIEAMDAYIRSLATPEEIVETLDRYAAALRYTYAVAAEPMQTWAPLHDWQIRARDEHLAYEREQAERAGVDVGRVAAIVGTGAMSDALGRVARIAIDMIVRIIRSLDGPLYSACGDMRAAGASRAAIDAERARALRARQESAATVRALRAALTRAGFPASPPELEATEQVLPLTAQLVWGLSGRPEQPEEAKRQREQAIVEEE